MALVFERESMRGSSPKVIIEKFSFSKKKEDKEEDTVLLNHNLAIPIAHLPRSSEAHISETQLQLSRRLPSEYLLPVLVSLTKDMTYIINKVSETPIVVASFSHAALGNIRRFEQRPGIPLIIFNKYHQEFMGRLTEESAYKDPPIRFGNFTFRRSQLFSRE